MHYEQHIVYRQRGLSRGAGVCPDFASAYRFGGVLFVVLFVFTQTLYAQVDSTLIHPDKLVLTMPWLHTHNAAGLGVSALPASGSTSFSGYQDEGSFRRAQQPDRTRQVVFHSERYQSVKALSLYGSFRFTQQWDDSIRYADLLDPYRGTPYGIADSMGGDWKKQFYELKLKAATGWLAQGKIKAGLGINYRNGTGARQNDPRPLNYSNEFSLLPAAVYRVNSGHTLGVNGIFRSYREEISLEIQKQGESHKLYRLLGLGEYAPPIGFSPSTGRVYAGKEYGGDLQYSRDTDSKLWLVEAGYRAYHEDARDGSSIPRPFSRFTQKEYRLTGIVQFGTSRQQQVKLQGQLQDHGGTEYHTTFNTSERAWVISVSLPLYNAKIYTAALSWQWIKPAGPRDFEWLLSADLAWSSIDREYVYPGSKQTISRLAGVARAGRNWFLGGDNFQLTVNAGYSDALQAVLNYREMTTTSNLVARKVLYPDQDYAAAAVLAAGLEATYTFKPAKKNKNRFYLNADAHIDRRMGPAAIDTGFTGSRTQLMFTLGSLF